MPLPTTSHSPLATSSDDVLVRVENVGKIFCRDLKKSLWYGMCDVTKELNPFQGASKSPDTVPPLRPGEFWANKDISFELRRGECLGLIGRNGAGKTTLLKMLNGLIKPDTGTITMRGRVGALIALGAGFNPVLTGRENVYVNASILGLSKAEVDEKIDDIIDFAEIREFIDSPVQSYSSGMQVRLGFAVATALDPDVLILDEVLAVGDAAFRFKCSNRIRGMLSKTAVIFVSHSMEQVAEICNRGILLQAGNILCKGDVGDAIASYNAVNAGEVNNEKGELMLSEVLSSFMVQTPDSVSFMGEFLLTLLITAHRPIEQCTFRVCILDRGMRSIVELNSRNSNEFFCLAAGKNAFQITIPNLQLKPGLYFLDIHANDSMNGHLFLARSFCQKTFEVKGFSHGHSCVVTIGSITKL